VDRQKLLESAFNILKQVNKRAFLEIVYKDEIGTGLGPTMEFYNLIADELKNKNANLWRKGMLSNDLFPSPLPLTCSHEDAQKVYELFRLAGTLVAKCLSDDRLFDLPISSLFWDLILGKVPFISLTIIRK